ncbi:MAG: hypothetical protein KGZ25_09290 [Planctomycetes bacterium]|nr:hypothetical protein [Planctomycetota bacterium]
MTYLTHIESHLQRLISTASDIGTDMWPSVLDVRTGRFPAQEHVPSRTYRLIGAPNGSTLYWDQSLVVSATRLSQITGKSKYTAAADRYIEAFLAECVAENGMFRWGNHQYYDLLEKKVIEFSGGHHEIRPITPAWDFFWEHDREKTASYIRAMARRHVYDRKTGGFNRHDDGNKSHAFLESGGILVESLAWLFSRTQDEELRDLALRIARYSYKHRDPSTGLVVNEPDTQRWDSEVSTTEVGLWARCLLQAAEYAEDAEFAEMATNATKSYLENGYDRGENRYFGQLKIDTGEPVLPDGTGYWPRKYSDPWNTDQWPTHDYPMPLAETCLILHEQTEDAIFQEAAHRWARIVIETSPEKTGKWAYAENYGRSIRFLTRAALQLGEDSYMCSASTLADQAVQNLYENGMFKGEPNGHFYESVDGVGFLVLGLILLETGGQPDEI